jgi:hypothetical protein
MQGLAADQVCMLCCCLLLQSMVQDEQTMRLVDLHKYESARRLPISDEVYRANANILLHDEPCYRWVQCNSYAMHVI